MTSQDVPATQNAMSARTILGSAEVVDVGEVSMGTQREYLYPGPIETVPVPSNDPNSNFDSNLNPSPSSESYFSEYDSDQSYPNNRRHRKTRFLDNILSLTEPAMESAFGTPAYYEMLAEKHLKMGTEFEKKLDNLDMGKPVPASISTILKRFPFLVTISMDYIVWELDREYKSIQKNRSTDHEQLMRLRKLLLEVAQALHLGEKLELEEMFEYITEKPSQPRGSREKSVPSPVLIPLDIVAKSRPAFLQENRDKTTPEVIRVLSSENNRKSGSNDNNIDEFVFKKKQPATWGAKRNNLNAIWGVFDMYGIWGWLRKTFRTRGLRTMYYRIRYQLRTILRWLSR